MRAESDQILLQIDHCVAPRSVFNMNKTHISAVSDVPQITSQSQINEQK